MHRPQPTPEETATLLQQLRRELENFTDTALHLLPKPGDVPQLAGIDVCGGTLSVSGAVGGDHIIYVDFKQRFDLQARIARATAEGRLEVVENLRRCQRTAGIALVDVSGHRVTDALLAAVLHQAFLVGATYELDLSGQVTKRLFEHLNTRFYQSSGAHKYVSLLYGEISEDATFRFLSAGHPFPTVFSMRHDRFMAVSPDLCVSFPPLGMQPSLHAIDRQMLPASMLGFKDRYEVNDWVLMGAGDILLLHTDGLTDHVSGDESYFPDRLERSVRAAKHGTAREIFDAVESDLLAFGPPADDVSLVVVKLG